MKNKETLKNLLETKAAFDRKTKKMKKRQWGEVEKKWDTESAYFSSRLEGSKIRRDDFDKLSKKVK